jgi:hypothetical protein
MIPGARELGMLTTSESSAASLAIIPDGPSTMDAVTTSERQREGGGAPSQRRPVRGRSRRQVLWHRLHEFVMTTRALFHWRFRTNHV